MSPTHRNIRDARVYRPIAADGVVINRERVLLVRRKAAPFKGWFALPGGYLSESETMEHCVIREVYEETGIRVIPKCIIGVYSSPRRDPRRTVSVAFYCTARKVRLHPGSDAQCAVWLPVHEALKSRLAFDHNNILNDALGFLKAKGRSLRVRAYKNTKINNRIRVRI
ncbi:MAG: NUDIX hydrolase [Candidatus Micrarchaeia archaeon]